MTFRSPTPFQTENQISAATEAYRAGSFFWGNPYPIVVPGTTTISNGLIAVQKVDVVAHSYGGILTRWYVEQSPEYAGRRDVRKIIELGTPNLGSPLANMVDEIYRNPIIAAAKTANVFHDFVDSSTMDLTEIEAVALIQRFGILPTGFPDTGGVREFYEVDSVNSSRLAALASDGFSSDVGYAAVVGQESIIDHASLYSALEPLGAFGESYFPWIVQFDGGAGQTDGVVPVWSAKLGEYNFFVQANHIQLVQNADVHTQVLQWLNDPAVPLGSAQRTVYKGTVPASQRSAYQGASGIDSAGHLTGGGLNPNAIIGVSFEGSGMLSVTWGTQPADAGIKTPILTGMIQKKDIGHKDFSIVAYDLDNRSVTVIDNLGYVSEGLNIDPAQMEAAGPDDWLAFHVTSGGVGRRRLQALVGPNGTGPEGYRASLAYVMPALPNVRSPLTPVYLPKYVLPTPVHNGLSVTVTGTVESQGTGSQGVEVNLYAKRTFFDDLLSGALIDVIHPEGAFPGVLLPYSATINLSRDPNGNVAGTLGSSGTPSASVYQYLSEGGISSGTVTVP